MNNLPRSYGNFQPRATLLERFLAGTTADSARPHFLMGDEAPFVSTFNPIAWAARLDGGAPAQRPTLSAAAARQQECKRRLTSWIHRHAPELAPTLAEIIAEPLGAMLGEIMEGRHER